MAKFTIRIEIQNSRVADYRSLQLKMEEAGFSRTIKEDGKVYLLPHSEYSLKGEKKIEKVLERVKAVTADVGKTCSILITQSAGRIASDLQEVV